MIELVTVSHCTRGDGNNAGLLVGDLEAAVLARKVARRIDTTTHVLLAQTSMSRYRHPVNYTHSFSLS
jgi:hypothetical protein